MADIETKVPTKTEEKPAERAAVPAAWRPFESLRREVDRLFEDFDRKRCTSTLGNVRLGQGVCCGTQSHGINSSMRFCGQPFTRRVSRSVK